MLQRILKIRREPNYSAEVDRLYARISRLARPILADHANPDRHFVIFDAIELLRDDVNADWWRTCGQEEEAD